uniref:RNA-binding protein 8A n=1 Tax=Tetraselmis sp. GSL018 TaxID=582737 RepID=A0A061QW28_9CHLO|mmetsp:Transcript_31567/g.75029  ORF Transcript_31567/g.75029 Transcript_31567/m.75029 type:complete len:201 (-) Transcript_31567:375-977(-)
MSLRDEDDAMDDIEEAPAPRLKSTVTTTTKRQKGRGFRERGEEEEYSRGKYDSLESSGGPGPAKSVEGWVVLVTNVHEEAQEEDIHEAFAEYGDVKNLHLNLDRRTGFVKAGRSSRAPHEPAHLSRLTSWHPSPRLGRRQARRQAAAVQEQRRERLCISSARLAFVFHWSPLLQGWRKGVWLMGVWVGSRGMEAGSSCVV